MVLGINCEVEQVSQQCMSGRCEYADNKRPLDENILLFSHMSQSRDGDSMLRKLLGGLKDGHATFKAAVFTTYQRSAGDYGQSYCGRLIIAAILTAQKMLPSTKHDELRMQDVSAALARSSVNSFPTPLYTLDNRLTKQFKLSIHSHTLAK